MKVMASVVLSLWVIVTLMAEAQQAVDSQIESRILQGFCGIISDDPDLPGQLLNGMKALGEPGRAALLAMAARGREKPAGRECAWNYLLDLKERRAISLLRPVLNDPKEPTRTRAHAALVLGHLNDTSVVDSTVRLLKEDPSDPLAGGMTIRALAEIDSDAARSALRAMFQTPELSAWSGALVEAVGRQRDVQALPLIIEDVRRQGGGDSVGREAAAALARIGTADSLVSMEAVVGGIGIKERSHLVDVVNIIIAELRNQLAHPLGRATPVQISAAIDHVQLYLSQKP